MDLKYNGVTLPEKIVNYLVNTANELKVLPSYLITKLHFEGVWGDSAVARENNNWSGMTWTGGPCSSIWCYRQERWRTSS